MTSIINEYTKSQSGYMLNFDKIDDLKKWLKSQRKENRRIGFVPTMGALHKGHMSLIEKAREENEIVVVSIFVNPTQFNNEGDLKNYPRTPVEDETMLEEYNVNALFSPSVSEIYNDRYVDDIPELGNIATVMEGEHRPGHFAGVVQIVSRLFKIVEPHKAYFGEKDFQQLAVIRYMTEAKNFPVQIVGCPTVREATGLAMSSRNMRLSDEGKKEASHIYKALKFVRDNKSNYSVKEIKQKAIDQIQATGKLEVEYLEIAAAVTLNPVDEWSDSENMRCFTAVFCEGVRLIDNVAIN